MIREKVYLDNKEVVYNEKISKFVKKTSTTLNSSI